MNRTALALAVVSFIVAFVAVLLSVSGRSASPDNEWLQMEIAGLREELANYQSSISGELEKVRAEQRTLAARTDLLQSSRRLSLTEASPGGSLDEPVTAENATLSIRRDAVLRFREMTVEGKKEAMKGLVDLARWGDEEALALLLESLSDEDSEMRKEAVEALGELADPAHLAQLEAMLDDVSEDVREEIAGTLSTMPKERAGPMLVRLLTDQNPDVVEEAINSIGDLNYANAAPDLQKLAQGDDLDLAAEAAGVLRQLGMHESADAALQVCANGLQSADSLERLNAIDRIETIGGPQAIELLTWVVQSDSSVVVREEAQKALIKLGG